MLKSLTVKCYKAFGKGKQRQTPILVGAPGKKTPLSEPTLDDYEGETLEIRPITVLLGANSVGKTSLLDLLLALQQTNVYATESYGSTLKLNGRIVSLGEVRLLFHRGNTDEPMELAFELDNSRRFLVYRDDFRKVLTDAVFRTESVFRISNKDIGPSAPTDLAALTIQELLDLHSRLSKLLHGNPELSELLRTSELTPGRKRPLYSDVDLSKFQQAHRSSSRKFLEEPNDDYQGIAYF